MLARVASTFYAVQVRQYDPHTHAHTYQTLSLIQSTLRRHMTLRGRYFTTTLHGRGRAEHAARIQLVSATSYSSAQVSARSAVSLTCLAFPCLATGLREIHRQKRMSFYTLILRPSRTRTRPSAYPLSLSRSHSSSLTPVLTPALTPPLPLFSSAPSSFVLCVPRVGCLLACGTRDVPFCSSSYRPFRRVGPPRADHSSASSALAISMSSSSAVGCSSGEACPNNSFSVSWMT
jgi:hypothetical protein